MTTDRTSLVGRESLNYFPNRTVNRQDPSTHSSNKGSSATWTNYDSAGRNWSRLLKEARKQGNRRVTGKEQYYTPPITAQLIVARLVEIRPDVLGRPWLEPAGGTGTFIQAALDRGVPTIKSYDIEPLHPSVVRGDFLCQFPPINGAVAVGNPPFGRNNALSVPFFNHATRFCDVICFIVPRSWRKWSVINRLDRSFHLLDDYDLAINYVDASGNLISGRSTLKTVVQTWEQRDSLRDLIVVRDMDVIQKAGPLDADVSLTIFGYGCGKVKTEFQRVPNTTQMFLKLRHPRALEALQAVDFSRFFNNTAYTEALSIQEINYLINEYLFGDPCLEEQTPQTLF